MNIKPFKLPNQLVLSGSMKALNFKFQLFYPKICQQFAISWLPAQIVMGNGSMLSVAFEGISMWVSLIVKEILHNS